MAIKVEKSVLDILSNILVTLKLKMTARKLVKSLKRTWEKFIRRNAMRN